MKKLVLTISLILLSSFVLFSQNETVNDSITEKSLWTTGASTSINFAQVSFTNWAAGGTSSVSLFGYTKLFANYQKNRHSWENSLYLGYGIVKEIKGVTRKSDDKIQLDSKYAYSFTKQLRCTAAAGFKSQFTKGFDYTEPSNPIYVSNFMAPGYITFGVGIDYIPWEWLTINYSPLLSKITIVTLPEFRVQYGNDSTQLAKYRLGSQLSIGVQKELFKNVNLTSMATFFTDYLDKEFGVVVNWDVLLEMKINNFMSANLTTNLIWDKDILTTDTNGDGVRDVAKVQFKELFGVGFTFSF